MTEEQEEKLSKICECRSNHFICTCGDEENADVQRLDKMLREASITGWYHHANFDGKNFYGVDVSFWGDQWMGVTVSATSRETKEVTKIFVQCDIIEHGILHGLELLFEAFGEDINSSE